MEPTYTLHLISSRLFIRYLLGPHPEDDGGDDGGDDWFEEGEEEEADEDMEVSDVEATSIDRLFLYMVLTYIMCRSAHIFIPVLSCTAKVGALCQVASTKPGPPTPRVCHIPRFPVACCIYVFDFFI